MMIFRFFWFSALLLVISGGKPHTQELYLVRDNGLWGYMDQSGQILIEPRFHNAGGFSEGLAPVREQGSFGYIDVNGTVVIAARFDFAEGFRSGIAKVFIDGKPYYIDREGKQLFEHNFIDIGDFNANGMAIVQTQTKKAGMVDKTGLLVIDTVYSSIDAFTDGLAVVKGLSDGMNDGANGETINQKGVIDLAGRMVVPYGPYREISGFRNGFSFAAINDSIGNTAVINRDGAVLFTEPDETWYFEDDDKGFNDGLAIIRISGVESQTSGSDSYMGAVNTKGRIEFSNKAWTAITPFSVNRAFAKDGQDRWWLINEKGAVVSETPFTKILYDSYYNDEELPFARGYAFVKANGGWCAIDPGGKVVITSSDLDDYSLTIRNGLLQLEKDVSTEDLGHPWKYGLWNTEAGKVIEPRYEAIYPVGEGNGLILAVENGLLTYIDPKGNQVWREQQPSDVLMPLNIDEMNRGYCYASSPYREDLAGFGGWGGSGNRSHAGAINERSNELAVFIDTSAKSTWQNKFSGLTMYVSNASCDTAFFAAQDSRLYLNLQAKDKQGQWRDIEYLPSSWCGNSYHQLFLGPAEHWKFVIPEYEGEFATLIRAKLRYQKTRGDREEVILFSNEIKGKINPGQFWNKSLYTPAGLMDPYLD